MGIRHRRTPEDVWVAGEPGEAAAADTALRDLLRLLPTTGPPPGFVGRVMTAAARDGLVPMPGEAAWCSPPVRLVLWCGVGAVALGATLVLIGPLLVRQVVRLLNFSVQGFVWIVGGLEGGLDAWSLMAEIGRAIAASLTTPQVSASIVVIELVGVAALYALHRVLSKDRESLR